MVDLGKALSLGLQGLASGAAGFATKNPTILQDSINRAIQQKQQVKSNQLANQGAQLEIDKRQKQLGFLLDGAKRKRAVEDALKIQQAKTPQAKQAILQGRIAGLLKDDPNADISDSLTALKTLQTDPALFNEGIKSTIAVGQAFGDITLPKPVKDEGKITEKQRFALAQTPEGRQQLRNVELAKQLPKEPAQEKFKTEQALVDGKPAFIQIGDQGTTKVLDERFQPIGKAGQSITTTLPDGTTTTFTQGGTAQGQGGKDPSVATAPVRNKLQQQIIDNEQLVGSLTQIKSDLQTKFLTTPGKFENAVRIIKDKLKSETLSKVPLFGKFFEGLSPEEQREVEEFQNFTTQAETAFVQFVKSISGAQVSEKEMERLKGAFINMDQGPTQFAQALDTIIRETNRADRISKRLLAQGFSLEEDDKAGQAEFSRLVQGGFNMDAQQRVNMLIDQGIPPQEVKAQLIMEGYDIGD